MGKHKGAYTLIDIDPELWRHVKSAAALKGTTIREWILVTLAEAVGMRAPRGRGGRSPVVQGRGGRE